MHANNSLSALFTERLLCAGTVLSMEETEARSTLPLLRKIRAHVLQKCHGLKKHLMRKQRRVFGHLKRTAPFNTWQCFLSRDQDPKSQARSDQWVVLNGFSVTHYLPLNEQPL